MKTVVIEKFPLFEKYEEKEKFFAAFPKELEPLRGKHVKKARKEYPENKNGGKGANNSTSENIGEGGFKRRRFFVSQRDQWYHNDQEGQTRG